MYQLLAPPSRGNVDSLRERGILQPSVTSALTIDTGGDGGRSVHYEQGAHSNDRVFPANVGQPDWYFGRAPNIRLYWTFGQASHSGGKWVDCAPNLVER